MPTGALRIDHERAKWVIETLLDAWRRKLPPYDRIKPVPSVFPANLIRGGREEANYYICACYFMRGKINSSTALIRLAALHEMEPSLFEPRNFLHLEGDDVSKRESEIQEHLRASGLGFNARETSRFWIWNFQKLARFWESNPLLWFGKKPSWKKLCKILMHGKGNPNSPTGFLCFREKMVGMFIYFLSQANIIDRFAFPGVIDFHNDRFGLSTEMITGECVVPGAEFSFEELAVFMRKIFERYAKDPATTIELADAIWHLSREFCSKNQGNSSHVSELYEARNTDIYPKYIKWDEGAIRRYHSSCGLCPVEEVCKWSIPSADNYIRGQILVKMERPVPHKPQVPLIQISKRIVRRGPLPEKFKPKEKPHEDQISIFE